MKICDDDPFFTVDVPVLRIRRSTPDEVTRRKVRWARCGAGKFGRRLEFAARGKPEPVRLVPWRELAAGWQQIIAAFEGLFENEEEEEQTRQAYHQGGPRWLAFLAVLNQRKRDRAGLTAMRR